MARTTGVPWGRPGSARMPGRAGMWLLAGVLGACADEPRPEWARTAPRPGEARQTASGMIEAAVPDDPGVKTSPSGAYRVTLTAAPEPIPLGRLFEVEAQVVDTNTGQAVTDAAVRIDARMPDHGHGMETAPQMDAGPHPEGRYRARGLKFHMPGTWTVQVDVDGAVDERIDFVRNVR